MYCVEMGLADSRDTYRPAEYWIKWAQLPWEIDEAYKLRRAVFCIEQGSSSATIATISIVTRNCWSRSVAPACRSRWSARSDS
jgi:hypothetical protein